VRREKISERMKILQQLVPGCDRVSLHSFNIDIGHNIDTDTLTLVIIFIEEVIVCINVVSVSGTNTYLVSVTPSI
jgi:hypothetical protein